MVVISYDGLLTKGKLSLALQEFQCYIRGPDAMHQILVDTLF